MTISDINTYVTFRTGATTTEYTAANRLISTNRWYHKVTDMIFNSLRDYQHDDLNQSTEVIISKNTVANQEYVALGLTDKILAIKRVEVSYDGSTYYKAEPIVGNIISDSIVDQTAINQNFQTTTPYYEHRGQLLYLYPVPTSSVSSGLKLWVQREAAEFTSGEVSTGTKEPGFDEPFHVMIALGMIYDWCSGKRSTALRDLKRDVEKELADYELRLRAAYGRKNNDSLTLKAAYQDYE